LGIRDCSNMKASWELGEKFTNERVYSETYSPIVWFIIRNKASQPAPTRINGFGFEGEICICDQITAISASVPTPPGKAIAASQSSISAYNRSRRVGKRLSSLIQRLGFAGRQASISSQVTPITYPPASADPREIASMPRRRANSISCRVLATPLGV